MIGPGAAQHQVDLDYAFQQGYDCGKNGPNQTNSHYAIFSSPEFTKAWEEGKRSADTDRSIK